LTKILLNPPFSKGETERGGRVKTEGLREAEPPCYKFPLSSQERGKKGVR